MLLLEYHHARVPCMETHGVIYGLHDPRTGELRYIGQTVKTVAQRLSTHLYYCSRRTHSYLARWLSGLVKERLSPTWSILATAQDQEELDFLEIEFISKARADGVRLVNLSDGGGGCYGRPVSTETREKISNSNKGKPHPKHTEEWRKSMSTAKKGINTNSPEHMVKLATAKIGKPRSEETKAKISVSKRGKASPRLGAHLSEEQRAKISSSCKGKNTGASHPQYRHDISTEQIQLLFAEGRRISEVARTLGVPPIFIRRRYAALGLELPRGKR